MMVGQSRRDGGLASVTTHRFVLILCPYLKIDVVFEDKKGDKARHPLPNTARVVEGDAGLIETLRDPAYPGKVERAIVFEVEAWDSNCPKHIHRRFPESAVAPVVRQFHDRIEELEAEVAELKSRADQSGKSDGSD